MADKNTAFRPLTDEEKTASVAQVHKMPEREPVVPVPDDAPQMRFRHPKLGEPVKVWAYYTGGTNGARQLAFYTARFDRPEGGKDILPISFCRLTGGKTGWRSKWPDPLRPMYRLPELAARPDVPVLIVEGEKTADAAADIFPDHATVTSSGGTARVNQTDWAPLRGRAVTIWPDADEPGHKAAREFAALAHEAGAASVHIVHVPEDWPDGWDLADTPPDEADVRAMLDEADPWQPEAAPQFVSWGSFKSGPQGVRYDDGEEPVTLCGPLEILAQTRSADGDNWGLYVRWRDDDGGTHEWALPRSLLAGDGSQMRAAFLSGGLFVAPGRKAREFLSSYLSTVKVKARARAVTRCGWHGNSFVLPDDVLGGDTGERTILQTDTQPDHAIRTSGTLFQWREHVSRPCAGNSRLVLAVSAAFAAPLLRHTGGESGGLHFMGPSSRGKTTALRCGGSVWGGAGDDPMGYARTWRATSNGLEAVAAAHSDCLLALDEMGQVSAREAGDVVYMLANGTGKQRATRTGGSRKAHAWRVLVLSTGEIGLDAKMREDGRGTGSKAGQLVRLTEIPAEAGAGHGLFEELHGASSGRQFADMLRDATQRFYGMAAREYIRRLIEGGVAELAGAFGEFRREFEMETCAGAADGQVKRTAARFALIGFAGELATGMGITGWPEGEARAAAVKCFRVWMDTRGGAGDTETIKGLEQVRAFLDEHGASRFPYMDEDGTTADTRPVHNRAGWRRRMEGGVEFCVFPSVWKKEITRSFDGGALLDVLRSHQHLRCDSDRRTAKVRTPDGAKNLYCIQPSFHEDGGGNG